MKYSHDLCSSYIFDVDFSFLRLHLHTQQATKTFYTPTDPHFSYPRHLFPMYGGQKNTPSTNKNPGSGSAQVG
jgi:hypothetical protein